jgi:hypothetical protein
VLSQPDVTAARTRFYRMVGRSLGLKIAAVILFLALVAYLGGR